MSNRSAQITSLTARHRLPAIFPLRYYAKLGGLLSYGSDYRILRGDKVGELPIQTPVKFELTINLKTAKALGLTAPPHVACPGR
jgi:putative ABC transport system substrate-binding protein